MLNPVRALTTKLILAAALVVAGLAVSGCQQGVNASGDSAAQASEVPRDATQPDTGPIEIVATTGMVADLVREVGGEQVVVKQVMGPGVDPHLYKASRDDVQAIMSADAVFYSGLMLEGKMSDTLIKVGRNKPVFAVTELIDAATLIEPDNAEGHPDPHVWMDVEAWSAGIEAVRAALTELSPAHGDLFTRNADLYAGELSALQQYAAETLSTIAGSRRVLVTSHDAFNYFGRAYDLDVIGVQGISTESEAGLQRINELVDLLVDQDVPAVFVESSVSPKNVRALVDGAAARGGAVRIGGELFSDAMGPVGTYEGTYVGMIDHNVTTVAHALGGDAPERGMQGKLTPAEAP